MYHPNSSRTLHHTTPHHRMPDGINTNTTLHENNFHKTREKPKPMYATTTPTRNHNEPTQHTSPKTRHNRAEEHTDQITRRLTSAHTASFRSLLASYPACVCRNAFNVPGLIGLSAKAEKVPARVQARARRFRAVGPPVVVRGMEVCYCAACVAR